MAGTPSTTSASQGQGTTPPGWGAANDIFNSLIGTANNNPFPVYGGQIDPGLSPTMQQIIQRGQGMASQGAPSIFQGVQGSLASFLNPQFQNPNLRIPQGFSDYFGMNPQQKLFGGSPLGSLGWSGPVGMPGSPGGGGPGQTLPWMPGGGGQSDSGNPPSTWGSSPGGGVDMSGRSPLPLPGGDSSSTIGSGAAMGGGNSAPSESINPAAGGGVPPSQVDPNAYWAARVPYYQPPSPSGGNQLGGGPAPMPNGVMGTNAGAGGGGNADILSQLGIQPWQSAVGTAKNAWQAAPGDNYGQMRIDPATGQPQISLSGGWQQFNPADQSMANNAQMFQRFGAGWDVGGGGGTGAHATDLPSMIGRPLTPQQTADYQYGVTPMPGQGDIAGNAKNYEQFQQWAVQSPFARTQNPFSPDAYAAYQQSRGGGQGQTLPYQPSNPTSFS
jgi:hypothetical protein